MRKKEYWVCPRCGKKISNYEKRCFNCGLLKERLSKVTNSAGKKALKNKEPNKVIYIKPLPQDVSKIKLLIYSILLGYTGAQYLTVGRKKMGIYMLVSFLLLNLLAILMMNGIYPVAYLDHPYWGLIGWSIIFPNVFSLMFWLNSIFQIIFDRFKVPVSIDESYFLEDLDDNVVDDIMSEVNKNRVNDKETIKHDDKIKAKELNNLAECQDIKTKSNKNNLNMLEETYVVADKKNNNDKLLQSKKKKKIRIICVSCGQFVKVDEDEKICPKCGEQLKG